MTYVVNFSSGAGSWAAAMLVVAAHGREDVVLLFADVRMEDPDNYRFLWESATKIGARLVILTEGRNPWQVMRDERFLANSRRDPCSKLLKRRMLDRWRRANCDPSDTTVVVGLDWTETHRVDRLRQACAPWRIWAPLAERFLSKRDVFDWMAREGLRRPRLYDQGFPHANCGGACVKAGQASWALLWRTMPERYLWHERQEKELRREIGDYSILRDRTGGASRTLTLQAFRERLSQQLTFDAVDWGGCGCGLPSENACQIGKASLQWPGE